MKKLAKKLLCLTAVLALTLSLFTGCKSKNEKTLFEYAGQEVTFQEAHVYARIMQYLSTEHTSETACGLCRSEQTAKERRSQCSSLSKTALSTS